jgi:putative salt-induced outer membrane protein YdiY
MKCFRLPGAMYAGMNLLHVFIYICCGNMRAMSRNVVPVLIQKIVYIVTSLTILSGSMCAHAIVSMEDVHLGKPPEGFTGAFELDLAFEGGNTDQAGAATGVKFQWTRAKVTDFILANYAYGESAGVTNKNRGFAHYRHIHRLDAELAWEGFSQLSADEFTNLRVRALLGGGVRLTLGEVNESKAFFLGLGAFYEREKLDTQLPDEDDTENALRANTYLVIKYQFNAHVSLVSTSYYQPKLGEFSDFRAIENFSLQSKLTEDSSLKIGLDIAHDSEPPRDIRKTDTSLTIGIVVNF